MVTIKTQPGICTYFCEKPRATSRTVRYNNGQSSRSMAHLLSIPAVNAAEIVPFERELLSSRHFTSPLQNVVKCWAILGRPSGTKKAGATRHICHSKELPLCPPTTPR